MKKSDISKFVNPHLSRDEVRQLLMNLGLDNFYQETEMDSPLVDTHQDISYTSDHVVQHSHIFYEIIYCAQGNLDYLLGVRRYQIQAGDMSLNFLPSNPETTACSHANLKEQTSSYHTIICQRFCVLFRIFDFSL